MTQRLRMALKNHLFQWPFYAMLCHSMQPPWELCRLCTMFAVFASGKVFHASASACAWSRLRCAQQHDTVGSLCVCLMFGHRTQADVTYQRQIQCGVLLVMSCYVFWLKTISSNSFFSTTSPNCITCQQHSKQGATAFYLGPFHSLKSAVI